MELRLKSREFGGPRGFSILIVMFSHFSGSLYWRGVVPFSSGFTTTLREMFCSAQSGSEADKLVATVPHYLLEVLATGYSKYRQEEEFRLASD